MSPSTLEMTISSCVQPVWPTDASFSISVVAQPDAPTMNGPWVEWKYVEVCREKRIDPWPPIRRSIACWLLGLAGVVVFLVMLAR